MSLNISNDYRSYTSYLCPIQPSYCLYYSNPQPPFSWSISVDNFSPLSNNHIPLRDAGNTRLHRKNRRYRSNTTAKQSINSDDYKTTDDHPSSSPNPTKQMPSIKQQLQRRSSIIPQNSTLVNDRQYSDLIIAFINHSRALRDQCANISSEGLTSFLDKFTSILKRFEHIEEQQQYLSIIIDLLTALTCVRSSVLISVSQHEFFSILQTIFIHLIRQWHRLSPVQGMEFLIFRKMAELVLQIIKAIDDLSLVPSWFTDSAVLEAISTTLINMVTSEDLLQENNRTLFKHFIHLIDAYLLYQQLINQYNYSQTDTLQQLLDSIIHCLTSSHFIRTFTSLPADARSMTSIEKFFLIKCPSFLISYNGSRLEQTMDSLLSTMLPQYAELLDKLIPSVNIWKRSMMRAVAHLLQLMSHGAHQSTNNAKHISEHLSIIDNVLKLVNEPTVYNNLHETLSRPETALMNTAITFLVNMINDSSIFDHIKQAQANNVFLRLTTCEYEPLVFNVYTLLAYITHEDDIRGLSNPGRLLAIAIQSLEKALADNNEKTTQIEQLLETLKSKCILSKTIE